MTTAHTMAGADLLSTGAGRHGSRCGQSGGSQRRNCDAVPYDPAQPQPNMSTVLFRDYAAIRFHHVLHDGIPASHIIGCDC